MRKTHVHFSPDFDNPEQLIDILRAAFKGTAVFTHTIGKEPAGQPDAIFFKARAAASVRAVPDLRKNFPLAVIAASLPKPDEEREITLLKNGTDHVFTMPATSFGWSILGERIKTSLRLYRNGTIGAKEKDIASPPPMPITHIDLKQRSFRYEGCLIENFPIQPLRLLDLLVSHPLVFFTREQIMEKALGSADFINERSVDSVIKRLRNALHERGLPDFIQTRNCLGYCFNPAPGSFIHRSSYPVPA